MEEEKALDGTVKKITYAMTFAKEMGLLTPENYKMYGAAILDMITQLGNVRPNSKIGIALNAPFSTPLYVHARKPEEFTADFLREEISQKMQSSKELEAGGREMEVTVTVLSSMMGSGRKSAGQVYRGIGADAPDLFVDNGPLPQRRRPGRTHTRINVSKYCLGIAIGAGIDRFEYLKSQNDSTIGADEKKKKERRFEAWKRMNETKPYIAKRCWNRARQILDSGNVDKRRNFTLEDARAIQNGPLLRNKFQLIIVNDEQDAQPSYVGPPLDSRDKVIPIAFFPAEEDEESGHFELITALPKFLGVDFYCTYCFTRHASEREHYNCPKKCTKCLADNCPRQGAADIICGDCHVKFSLQECYDRHKALGTHGGASRCEKTKTCDKCEQVYYGSRDHVCGMAYCRACRAVREDGHTHSLAKCLPNKKYSHKRIFFDLETMEEVNVQTGFRVHKVVLACALRCCKQCRHIMPNSLAEARQLTCTGCSNGGNRYVQYDCISPANRGVNVQARFTRWLFHKQHKGFTAVAHNMKGFDGQVLLNYILKSDTMKPQGLILNGKKINLIEHNDVRVLDSFNYVPFALAKFSKAFDVPEITKGEFPFKFIKKGNFSYIGDLPPRQDYGYENKTTAARKKFNAFYEEKMQQQAAGTYQFHFDREIRDYCFSDVALLAASMTKFEASFFELTDVVLFEETTTSAGAAITTFQRKYLQENTMALDVDPSSIRVKQSAIALRFLAYLQTEETETIRTVINGGEYKIPGTRFTVDGFIRPCEKYPRGKALEFYGCYWHACPCRYSPTQVMRGCDTAADIRRHDAEREAIIRQHCDLEIYWECDVKADAAQNPVLKDMLNRNLANGPVVAREGLFGGRTEVIRLKGKSSAEKKLSYLDFTSLYPFVMKTCKYPVGEGQVLLGSEIQQPIRRVEDLLRQCRGYMSCKVVPPRGLFLPVLPYRAQKLLFTLCRTCGEEGNRDRCQHDDDERALYGTWTSVELELALEKGYVVQEVYGAIHWDNWTDDLFTGYIDSFLKLKQEASGWPEWAQTEEQKARYIDEYKRVEGIQLEAANIRVDEVKRQIAKLLLNSLWGKFGQRVDNVDTHIVRSAGELFKLMNNPTLEIWNVNIHSNTCVTVQTRAVPGTLQPLSTSSIQYAVLTTAYARRKLYEALDKIPCPEENLLYMDTDSLIFSSDTARENPLESLIGSYLGDLTSEVKAGSEMTAFVTVGAKSYAFKETDGNGVESFKVKAKGFAMNYDAEQKLRFEVMERQVDAVIAGEEEIEKVRVNYETIQRRPNHELVNVSVVKEFGFTFDKRVIQQDGGTYPYGF